MDRYENSPWLTMKQAMAYSGYGRTTLTEALKDEELRGLQRTKPGGTWRIHIDDLDAWMDGEKPQRRRHLRSA